jgi:[protein-PII] uridylyltransferase
MSYNILLDASEDTDPAITALDDTLAGKGLAVGNLKEALEDANEELIARFKAGHSATDLVRLRATLVDRVLLRLWREHGGALAETAALAAVGGYGRGELHPYSDVDVMVLLAKKPSAENQQLLSAFVTSLWDIGLDIGHSVRTVKECYQQAKEDLTIMTTLIEARLLDGPRDLFDDMKEAVSEKKIWSSADFFEAKRNEQVERHHRFDDTAYRLEPNVKGSPGGLRDIQMIGWVAKRHFGVSSLDDLVQHDFLTPGQLQILKDGQDFLWRVRFGLHVLTGRQENRLLFDHQTRLAKLLGYEDATYTLAVEQLMQRYYRTVMDLSRVNEMLLQLFEEAILMDPDAEPVRLDDQFQVKNGFLQTADDLVFQRNPTALLEMFLTLEQHPDIRGMSAYTIGLIKRNLYLIDEEFRQNPRNHRLFLDILRARQGVTHALRRMNRYGVLGLYIPSFGRIVGRMQYDLFHAYTVDEHTLFVISNLRKFALTRYDNEYPHCSRLMQSFEKPEIVFLAALFHDIAKGRGGDHSELGAVDAEAFCLEHGLSKYEARTVSWLVRHHLVLSTTAQKKDIGDPNVVNDFAALVGDKTHLDYLYVLTVADVRGTNPNLWNTWKATLFRDLYELTARALRRGLENPIDREQLILEKQEAAREMLEQEGVSDARASEIWSLFSEDYFLRHRSEEIAWHTEVLADSDMMAEHGFVDVRKQPDADGIQAVFYTPQKKRTFAHGTAGLGELGMTIVDARILPLRNGYSLDTYIFMEFDKRVEVDESRMSKIRRTLTRVLTAPDEDTASVTRPAPRQVRMFTTKTSIDFHEDKANRRTVMELVAGDRPGLLSDVGRTFVEMGINIDTAKIMTIGERAEDVFYISDESGQPLDDESCALLKEKLVDRLDAKA